MPDVHDIPTRSYNMSRIRGKNTKIELLVRKYLHAQGFRFRVDYRRLPGRPDIALPRYKTAIFIHGCFFHVHACQYFKWPKGNRRFWKKKLLGNQERDLRNQIAIKSLGWKIIQIWGCELNSKKIIKTLTKLPGKIMRKK